MIAGAGFAMMAWRLAQSRTRAAILRAPAPRWACRDSRGTPSAEYYRIIDRAAHVARLTPGTYQL